MSDHAPYDPAILEQINRIAEEVERLRLLLAPPSEPSCFVHGQAEWRPSMVRWLASAIAHLDHLGHAIDYLAESPDEEVSIEALYEMFGTNRNQLGNEFGRMSRLMKEKYGFTAYPFRAWQSSSDNKMRYQMPELIADWWNESRSGSSSAAGAQ